MQARLLVIALPLLVAVPPARAQRVVREERLVTVGTRSERWRLEWAAPPSPACLEAPVTCPCQGFAYGERGELNLLREGSGIHAQRFNLAGLFGHDGEAPGAWLQRWAPAGGDEAMPPAELPQAVAARAEVAHLDLRDYDHDGRATEFALQVGAGPCGHRPTVVVGLDRRLDRLHVFGTAEHPDRPLVLESPEAWHALAQRTPSRALRTSCGDHGSDVEEVVRLSADARGLHAILERFRCDARTGRPGRRQSREVL